MLLRMSPFSEIFICHNRTSHLVHKYRTGADIDLLLVLSIQGEVRIHLLHLNNPPFSFYHPTNQLSTNPFPSPSTPSRKTHALLCCARERTPPFTTTPKPPLRRLAIIPSPEQLVLLPPLTKVPRDLRMAPRMALSRVLRFRFQRN